MELRAFLKRVRYADFNRRSMVLFVAILSLLLIFGLNIGGSVNEPYAHSEETVVISGNPDVISVPSNNNFNNSNVPSFSVPGQFTVPSFLTNPSWGSFDYNGSFGLPSDFSVPDITIPSFSIPSFSQPSFSQPSLTSSRSNQPSLNPTSTAGDLNITFPERDNKARNMPVFNFFDNSSFEIGLPSFTSDIHFTLTIEGVVFVLLLVGILFLNKKWLPELLAKLDMEDMGEVENEYSEFFITPTEDPEEIRMAIERRRRLMKFGEYVNELIERSKERMGEGDFTQVIISGYHELDDAFSEFAKLQRTKDTTPLEHANSAFESGEINNLSLEAIVNLFYISRFGYRELEKADAQDFIFHLSKLVREVKE